MRILIIQTAFIGDVVLATPIAEQLHQHYIGASIDFLVRKGNEGLFDQHPFVNEVLLLDKTQKVKSIVSLVATIRDRKYDLLINVHRFFSSALLTVLSGADETIGFRSSWLSIFFTRRVRHLLDGRHEVDRNLELLPWKVEKQRPKLYVDHLQKKMRERFAPPYVVIAPGTIWETKKMPLEKWIGLIHNRLNGCRVYLIGGKMDRDACDFIKASCGEQVINMAGELSMLESVALIKEANMCYANDSAPVHFASAVNAPVTAVFCSTIPSFGFGPLSDKSFIAEASVSISCRPCGLHGKKSCPKGHFKCGNTVSL